MNVFQVGVGSGGIAVLDALARDERITRVVLLDPDTYQTHNIDRHVFGPEDVGRLKVDLAAAALHARRPSLTLEVYAWDLCGAEHQLTIEQLVSSCDLGVCAADNERAKFHFDALMRRHAKPWTLGEVLSGGIGGFVHRFTPAGPCYGCVASFLQRSVVEAPAGPPPDYAHPGGAVPETRIPASRAAIQTIAGLHALITLDLLADAAADPGFSSLLLSLQKVDGVFAEAYRPHKFRIPKLDGCLVCGVNAGGDNLDVALDQAFARLGDA